MSLVRNPYKKTKNLLALKECLNLVKGAPPRRLSIFEAGAGQRLAPS